MLRDRNSRRVGVLLGIDCPCLSIGSCRARRERLVCIIPANHPNRRKADSRSGKRNCQQAVTLVTTRDQACADDVFTSPPSAHYAESRPSHQTGNPRDHLRLTDIILVTLAKAR